MSMNINDDDFFNIDSKLLNNKQQNTITQKPIRKWRYIIIIYFIQIPYNNTITTFLYYTTLYNIRYLI